MRLCTIYSISLECNHHWYVFIPSQPLANIAKENPQGVSQKREKHMLVRWEERKTRLGAYTMCYRLMKGMVT